MPPVRHLKGKSPRYIYSRHPGGNRAYGAPPHGSHGLDPKSRRIVAVVRAGLADSGRKQGMGIENTLNETLLDVARINNGKRVSVHYAHNGDPKSLANEIYGPAQLGELIKAEIDGKHLVVHMLLNGSNPICNKWRQDVLEGREASCSWTRWHHNHITDNGVIFNLWSQMEELSVTDAPNLNYDDHRLLCVYEMSDMDMKVHEGRFGCTYDVNKEAIPPACAFKPIATCAGGVPGLDVPQVQDAFEILEMVRVGAMFVFKTVASDSFAPVAGNTVPPIPNATNIAPPQGQLILSMNGIAQPAPQPTALAPVPSLGPVAQAPAQPQALAQPQVPQQPQVPAQPQVPVNPFGGVPVMQQPAPTQTPANPFGGIPVAGGPPAQPPSAQQPQNDFITRGVEIGQKMIPTITSAADNLKTEILWHEQQRSAQPAAYDRGRHEYLHKMYGDLQTAITNPAILGDPKKAEAYMNISRLINPHQGYTASRGAPAQPAQPALQQETVVHQGVTYGKFKDAAGALSWMAMPMQTQNSMLMANQGAANFQAAQQQSMQNLTPQGQQQAISQIYAHTSQVNNQNAAALGMALPQPVMVSAGSMPPQGSDWISSVAEMQKTSGGTLVMNGLDQRKREREGDVVGMRPHNPFAAIRMAGYCARPDAREIFGNEKRVKDFLTDVGPKDTYGNVAFDEGAIEDFTTEYYKQNIANLRKGGDDVLVLGRDIGRMENALGRDNKKQITSLIKESQDPNNDIYGEFVDMSDMNMDSMMDNGGHVTEDADGLGVKWNKKRRIWEEEAVNGVELEEWMKMNEWMKVEED